MFWFSVHFSLKIHLHIKREVVQQKSFRAINVAAMYENIAQRDDGSVCA